MINETNKTPIWHKYTLTIEEAADYFRIGQSKLAMLIDRNPGAIWILENGNRKQIKRRLFEQFIDSTPSI